MQYLHKDDPRLHVSIPRPLHSGQCITINIRGVEEMRRSSRKISQIAQDYMRGYQPIIRGDELRCPLFGTWKVCRVDYSLDAPEIICTNGAATRRFLRWCVHVGAVEHYRNGVRIEHRKGRRLRDALLED